MIRARTHKETTNSTASILSVFLISLAVVAPGIASGQPVISVINIDFEAGAPGDATFAADDAQYGILSTPGPALWNSVEPNLNKNNLLDETGTLTGSTSCSHRRVPASWPIMVTRTSSRIQEYKGLFG